ncbi:MAG TPA: hypothetical protein VG708_03205 [Mycobacteriales bacterium]|nr:hypothetical protein [Mycobacteriales bacterium]
MTTLIDRLGTPLRHPLRLLVAVALLVAADAHMPVIAEHLHEAPYIGALFLALTLVCLAHVVPLTLHDSPALYVVTALVTGLAFLAYVLSRSVGLPQITDDIGDWLDPLGVTSIVSEGVGFLTAMVVLIWPQQARVAAARFAFG